ncbi:uncharacterized protein RSE6_06030 [Rhynchosporium secalis]|uniref:Uncharacterized protein n=1 Tax=Rhynchosporium secalis TaxID=38038 RepID=A0A1E1M9D2_RHYSE|nr:uncharacterized protein RSE6_06030 [Rhynchosporium secalis]
MMLYLSPIQSNSPYPTYRNDSPHSYKYKTRSDLHHVPLPTSSPTARAPAFRFQHNVYKAIASNYTEKTSSGQQHTSSLMTAKLISIPKNYLDLFFSGRGYLQII